MASEPVTACGFCEQRVEAAADGMRESYGFENAGMNADDWAEYARTALHFADAVDPLRSPATTDRADIEEALSDHLAQCPMVEMAQRLNGTPAASWWFKLMELRAALDSLPPGLKVATEEGEGGE